jgi:hypothetical protein
MPSDAEMHRKSADVTDLASAGGRNLAREAKNLARTP